MYSTSDKYKELIYSGKKCLLNIYIDGTLIDDNDIYSFKVTHNLFDGGKVSLGSTTSKSIELEINREALPETYSNFYVETGLTIDGVDEIVPIGYFTLEEINKDEDVVSITAVDYMMKFEKIISDFVSSKAIEILQAICDVCGVELATTDFVGSDTELIIYDGTTMTARQVIGYIAELAGGFATIGRNGKLYIKRIGENTTTLDIDLFGDYSWGEKFVCNEVDFINDNYDYEISDSDYSSAYLDCVLDSSLYDNEIKGQSLELNNNNPFTTREEQVRNIYDIVKGLELNGFNGQSLLDPALDIGDIIYIDEKPIVFQGDMEYLGYFKGNISSTIETKEKSKTTVQTISLASKLKQVSDKVSEVEGNVENKVDLNEIISAINKSDEEIQIQAEKVSLFGKEIDLTGDNITIKSDNFSVDEEGNVVCSNAKIIGGKIVLGGDEGEGQWDEDSSLIIRRNFAGAGTAYDYMVAISTAGVKVYRYETTGQNASGATTYEEYESTIEADGINTPKLTQTSLETQKKNFEKIRDALNIIKNIDIYKYNLKIEDDGTKKHIGFVIGDNYKYSKDVTSEKNDGVDIYSFVSLCCKAIQEVDEKYSLKIQEQHEELKLLKEEIKSLKGENNG